MGISIAKLLGLKDDLQRAKWFCEYEGKEWEVSDVDLDMQKNIFRLECRITREGESHSLKVVEHFEGGGDSVEIDGVQHDADHHLDVATKLLKRQVKVKIKSEYDTDPEPGFEKVLRLWCHLKVKIL